MSGPGERTHSFYFQRRTNNSIDPARARILHPQIDQIGNRRRVAKIGQILLIKARKNGNRQKLRLRIASSFHRGLHHAAAAMHCKKGRCGTRAYLLGRSFHRLANVIQLQIQKHLVAGAIISFTKLIPAAA